MLRAGRRFGKSKILSALAADEAIRGRPVGYFCPLFKTAVPVFDDLELMLAPLIISKSRGHELRISTGGVIDIWSLEGSSIVGRGRQYARVLFDEIAFIATTTDMGTLWRASISPTLINLDGFATCASTPWGTDPQNWFFAICNDKSLGWVEMHARTEDNPLLAPEVLEEARRANNPLVWRQEYLAEFTSLDAAALIDVTKLLQPDGEPWPEPERFDMVFVTVDSAIKTGAGADGTAALLCGVTRMGSIFKRLWFLDYDIVQVAYAEVPAFMARLKTIGATPARALEFLILTATRTNETLSAQWDEIDRDHAVWTIPASRMKTNEAFSVPLSDRALDILRTVEATRGPNPFVFPGRPQRPLSNMVLAMMLRRMGETVTVHGFRTSWRTWASEVAHAEFEIAEMCLSHRVGSAVSRAYNRTSLLERRRPLMAAWASFLSGADASNKIPIRASRS